MVILINGIRIVVTKPQFGYKIKLDILCNRKEGCGEKLDTVIIDQGDLYRTVMDYSDY